VASVGRAGAVLVASALAAAGLAGCSGGPAAVTGPVGTAAPPSAAPPSAAPPSAAPAAPDVPPPTTSRPAVSPPAATTAAPPPTRPAAPRGRRVPSRSAPLRVLITGDSMQESSGPTLLRLAGPAVRGRLEVRFSSGLVRPDFFDWPVRARAQVAAHDPEAVFFMVGGNEGQGITLPGGRVLPAGGDAWAAEYERRAAQVMRTYAGGGGRSVYWIGMPHARSARLSASYRVLSAAARRAAAQVPGVTYVDAPALFAPGGVAAEAVRDERGRLVPVHGGDGIHLSLSASQYLARRLLVRLRADWGLPG
jgi:hypothetical protein